MNTDTKPIQQPRTTLEAIRRHPAMYTGGTEQRGLHNLLDYLLAYAIDEVMLGRCTELAFTLEHDGETITLEDNGSGLPMHLTFDEGRSLVEAQLQEWELAQPVFEAFDRAMEYSPEAPRCAYGYKLGLGCAAAVARVFTLQVWRDGSHYEQTFHQGVAPGPCTRIPSSHWRGTSMTYSLDPEIFQPGTHFDAEKIGARLRELAFLNPALSIQFHNKRQGTHETFAFKNGIADGVAMLTAGSASLLPLAPFFCAGTEAGVTVEVAFQYTDRQDAQVNGYVNSTYMKNGGTHLGGFYAALRAAVRNWARSNGGLAPEQIRINAAKLQRGLYAIVNVRLPKPKLDGSTLDRLLNPEAKAAVRRVFGRALRSYFQAHPDAVSAIMQHVIGPAGPE